jgi:diaminopimelate epimerase
MGPKIERHTRFPRRTNVEFVRAWKKEDGICRARVEAWERGAGATLSCGSGAVAVAALLHKLGQGNHFVIAMTDFELRIRFEGEQAFLSGPCALVAEGRYFS